MPGVPSNKACERCKKKHFKCDETRPKCQRCNNAGVDCPGYVQMRKFIDQGATVRRRYAPYTESHSRANAAETRGKEDEVQSSEPAQNTIQEASSFMNQPSHDLPMISPPRERSQDEGHRLQTQGTQGTSRDDLPQTTTGDPQNQAGLTRIPSQATLNSANRDNSLGHASYFTGFGQERNVLPTEESPRPSTTSGSEFDPRRPDSDPEISGSLSNQNDPGGFHDIFSELMTGTEHEVAYLTRYFSEFLGPWLDISDSSKFFAVYVPIRAINSDFLKYAIAALAAKHLGRLHGEKPPAAGRMFTSPANMEIYPNSAGVDWVLKGANYYYLAFSNMRSLVSDSYGSVSSSAILESPIGTVSRWLSLQSTQAGLTRTTEAVDADSLLRKIDGLLAAVVILTMYRLLDAPGECWQSHLVGIEPLFDSLLQLHTGPSAVSPRFSHGARAAFWNLARQDYLGSYVNRAPTHLKQDNLSMWRAAGIQIHELEPLEGSPGLSQEDVAATTLIWLMNKTVNFLADYKRSQIAQWTESDPQAQPTTTAWLNLCFEFQNWLEKVPETFRPSLRIERPRDMSNTSEATYLPFPEVFYSLPPCGAAMQHYHFGRLALLLNRPPDVMSAPSTAFDRLASLREVTKEVDYRCREICGIALSRPRGEVRVHMAPLLLAVGQCLETPETRQVIVDLLRGVEADLGLSTASTVDKLQSVWSQ